MLKTPAITATVLALLPSKRLRHPAITAIAQLVLTMARMEDSKRSAPDSSWTTATLSSVLPAMTAMAASRLAASAMAWSALVLSVPLLCMVVLSAVAVIIGTSGKRRCMVSRAGERRKASAVQRPFLPWARLPKHRVTTGKNTTVKQRHAVLPAKAMSVQGIGDVARMTRPCVANSHVVMPGASHR